MNQYWSVLIMRMLTLCWWCSRDSCRCYLSVSPVSEPCTHLKSIKVQLSSVWWSVYWPGGSADVVPDQLRRQRHTRGRSSICEEVIWGWNISTLHHTHSDTHTALTHTVSICAVCAGCSHSITSGMILQIKGIVSTYINYDWEKNLLRSLTDFMFTLTLKVCVGKTHCPTTY